MTGSSRKRYSIATAVGLALAAPVPASAAVECFLELEGIKGESQVQGIDVLGWGFSLGESSKGEVCAEAFNFAKLMDDTTPELVKALNSGMPIGFARLSGYDVRDDGGKKIFEIELKRVKVTSYQLGATQGSVPEEGIDLDYESAEGYYLGPVSGNEEYFSAVPGKCD